jgi:hypothetical protein
MNDNTKLLKWFNAFHLPLDHFGLIGALKSGGGLIAIWMPGVGLRFVVIEDDEFAAQCLNYLEQRGVRHYASAQEMIDAFR